MAGAIVWKFAGQAPTTQVNNYISKQGKSAYDIAVAHGFVGTETMWIDSLKATSVAGPKGDDGKDSVSHDTVEKTTTKETTIKENAIQGPQGVAGANGTDGKTPELAQDRTTGQLFTRLPGDDDWHVVPSLCLGVLCGGTQ